MSQIDFFPKSTAVDYFFKINRSVRLKVWLVDSLVSVHVSVKYDQGAAVDGNGDVATVGGDIG